MLDQYNNSEDTWLGADRHVLLMPEYDGRFSPRPILRKTRDVIQLHCDYMDHVVSRSNSTGEHGTLLLVKLEVKLRTGHSPCRGVRERMR